MGILKSSWQWVLGCFVMGALALLPLVVTVGVVIWLVGFAESFVGPDTVVGGGLSQVGLKFSNDSAGAYLIGCLVVLVFVFLLGVVLQLGAARLFRQLTEAVFQRIPIVGQIYGTTQQFVGLLDKKKDTDLHGMKPVFCTFGSPGSTGVLALQVSPEVYPINGGDYYAVIIPTAPVPFGGGLLFIPADQVHPAEMSVDALISVYVSMGATTGRYLQDDQPQPKTKQA